MYHSMPLWPTRISVLCYFSFGPPIRVLFQSHPKNNMVRYTRIFILPSCPPSTSFEYVLERQQTVRHKARGLWEWLCPPRDMHPIRLQIYIIKIYCISVISYLYMGLCQPSLDIVWMYSGWIVLSQAYSLLLHLLEYALFARATCVHPRTHYYQIVAHTASFIACSISQNHAKTTRATTTSGLSNNKMYIINTIQ